MPKAHKVVTDGSYRDHEGVGTAAYIIENPDGERVGNGGRYFENASSSQEMEMRAVIMALKRCSANNINYVAVATDNEQTAEAINAEYPRNYVQQLIHQWKSSLTDVTAYHFDRDMVQEAHDMCQELYP